MKYAFPLKYSILLVAGLAFGKIDNYMSFLADAGINISNSTNQTERKMKLKIGDQAFTATLYNNETATAFQSLLPVTLDMIELNGNEKYAALPNNLPTNAVNPRTIQAGDLMLYGASTLVVFYKNIFYNIPLFKTRTN